MKKTIRISVLLLLGSLLLSLPSCQKEEEPDTYDIWLPQALKDIFVMKPGTYWVMEAVSGSQTYRDSVYVTEVVFDTLDILHPGSKLPYALKDRFRVKCFSAFYGREFHVVSETSDLCNNVNFSEPCFTVWVENYSQEQVSAKSKIFYFPGIMDGGWNSGNGNSQVRIIDIVNEYQAGGIIYKNVWHVEVDKDPTLQNTRSFRHISPEAGIIQWKIPEYDVEWITIRANIVR